MPLISPFQELKCVKMALKKINTLQTSSKVSKIADSKLYVM